MGPIKSCFADGSGHIFRSERLRPAISELPLPLLWVRLSSVAEDWKVPADQHRQRSHSLNNSLFLPNRLVLGRNPFAEKIHQLKVHFVCMGPVYGVRPVLYRR